jgi:hypothetical protein
VKERQIPDSILRVVIFSKSMAAFILKKATPKNRLWQLEKSEEQLDDIENMIKNRALSIKIH